MANHITAASKLNPEAPSFIPHCYQNINQTQSASFFPNISQYQYHHYNHIYIVPNHHDQTVAMQYYQPVRSPNRPVVLRGSPSSTVDVGHEYLGFTTRSERQRRARGNYHFYDNINVNNGHVHGGARVSSWQRKTYNNNARLMSQHIPLITRPRKMSYVRKRTCDSSSSMPSPSNSSSRVAAKVNADHDGINVTTLMIRNVPSKYTRQMLMDFLDDHCKLQNQAFANASEDDQDDHEIPIISAYDFLYLPIDFRSKLNKGYAFVNFTGPEGASKFEKTTNNQKWVYFQSSKIREIAIAALQGKDQLVKHFENMKFGCEDEEFLPVWFSPARNGTNNELVKAHTVGKPIGYNTRKLFYSNRRSSTHDS